MSSGTLYLVATTIGNIDDLTFRARQTLEQADIIVCEERKIGSKFLRSIDIKPPLLLMLSEHSQDQDRQDIINLLLAGKNVALISDAGTPLLADPGSQLLNMALEKNIAICPIPGPSSPLAALVASGFHLHRWHYRGFLSPKKEIRRQELEDLKNCQLTTIIMETPYRLLTLLKDLVLILQKQRKIALAWQLTYPDEEVIRGFAKEVYTQVQDRGWKKGEFVVVVGPIL